MAKRSERIWRRFEQLGLDDWYQEEYPMSMTKNDVIRCLDSDEYGSAYVVLPYTSSGDYVGSRVETSNCEVLRENYPDIVCVKHYGCGSTAARVWLGDLVDSMATNHQSHAIWDDLKSLESYPVLDEQRMTELEMEDMQEAWDWWAQSDLMGAIFNLVVEDEYDQNPWDLEPIELGQLESAAWDYGHAEGCGWWWDIERLAKHVVEDRPELVRWVTQERRGV